VSDEVSGGPGPGPGRPRTALLVLVAAAVIVAGVVSLRRGVEPVRVPPPASPPAAQMPPPPGQVGPPSPEPLPEVPALLVNPVCEPLRTDGHSRLDVSFMLVNTIARPVTLVRIKPVLPLGGLRELSTEYRSGTCIAPGAPLRTRDVRAGGTLLVVLRLALPPTCPAPYPVEADLTERRDGRVVTAGIHLLSDLGAVHFTTC
jgi:hypothetical protein